MFRSLATSASDADAVPSSGQSAHPAAAGDVPQCACVAEPREETRRLFVDVVQANLIKSGDRPAPRPVFRKVHGIARASLRIDPGIPERFRHGFLAYNYLPAWVRFSSDTDPKVPDASNATIGIGIKLFNLRCGSLDDDDPTTGTADLLMQNHDRFFVDTGRDFCTFSTAAVHGASEFNAYLAAHPETKIVLNEMAKREDSVAAATYFSVLPYACGPEVIVKYRLRPITDADPIEPGTDTDYLRLELANRLSMRSVAFELAVQTFSSDAETPLDAATRRWTTPFVPIGMLVLERQDVTTLGQDLYGENLSFNPWRTPAANRPIGSIADSRRITYRSSAFVRRTANGISANEPLTPR